MKILEGLLDTRGLFYVPKSCPIGLHSENNALTKYDQINIIM